MCILVTIFAIVLYAKNYNPYYLVTDKQISTIIKKENVNILGTETIYRENIPVTVISYTLNNEIGIIEASNLNGKLKYLKSQSTSINKQKKVGIMGANAGLKYVVITFFDEKIKENTNQILISFKNKQKLIDYIGTEDISIIVPLDDIIEKSLTTVELDIDFIDKSKNVIYRYPPKSVTDNHDIDYYEYLYSSKESVK